MARKMHRQPGEAVRENRGKHLGMSVRQLAEYCGYPHKSFVPLFYAYLRKKFGAASKIGGPTPFIDRKQIGEMIMIFTQRRLFPTVYDENFELPSDSDSSVDSVDDADSDGAIVEGSEVANTRKRTVHLRGTAVEPGQGDLIPAEFIERIKKPSTFELQEFDDDHEWAFKEGISINV